MIRSLRMGLLAALFLLTGGSVLGQEPVGGGGDEAGGASGGARRDVVDPVDVQGADDPADVPGADDVKRADAAGAVDAAASEVATAELPAISITPPKPAYRDLGAALGLMGDWAKALPDHVSLVELGTSAGGRPIRGIRIAGAGSMPAAERRFLAFVGGLDGVSLHGAEEVLAIAAGLCASVDQLPSDMAFLCLPWASPDGLVQEQARISGMGFGTAGRDASDVDDDLDGLTNEDGPDDLDGDGRVTMMLIEDGMGAWCRAPDTRFLVPFDSESANGARYRLVLEGADDDKDGQFNEDGPGGVRADRNFPKGWRGPFAGVSPGPLPFSSASAAAIAGLAKTGNLAGAIFFQGHSGRAEVTRGGGGGKLANLAAGLMHAGLEYQTEDGRALLVERAAVGSAIDWLPELGIEAVRLSFWGPEIGLGRSNVRAAGFRSEDMGVAADRVEDFCSPLCLTVHGDGWQRFLDERRGGIGFVDWHPVELDGGRMALVGGWEPAVLGNPPGEQLDRPVVMAMNWVAGLIAALPKVAVEMDQVRREGELCTLSARWVSSARDAVEGSQLPINFLAPGGLQMRLELPVGARLIAGPVSQDLDTSKSAGLPTEWLVFAPADALMGISIVRKSDGVVLDRREVRP